MSLKDYIKYATVIDKDQQPQNNIEWSQVDKSKKNEINPPRARGELPYYMENNFHSTYHDHNKKKTKPKKQRSNSGNMTKIQNTTEKNDTKSVNNFAQITPIVREVSGGWNTQSNEVIEKRIKERQQQYVEEKSVDNSSTSSSSLNGTCTGSSETSSYKTTMQDSFELKLYNEQKSKEDKQKEMERYKKNALMKGLILSSGNFLGSDECSGKSSAEFLDASESIGELTAEIDNLNLQQQHKIMQADRIYRLFRSNEDDDVYCHPLKEEIKKDPEWQRMRLARKGIEIVHSPRDYYLNVDNDSFAFCTK